MLREVEYHPMAQAEIQESVIWYDNKIDGLGLGFMLEVKASESKIARNPETWPNYEAGTKRYLMKKFPYAIIYLITEDRIKIVAVAPYKRKPGYWKERLDSNE